MTDAKRLSDEVLAALESTERARCKGDVDTLGPVVQSGARCSDVLALVAEIRALRSAPTPEEVARDYDFLCEELGYDSDALARLRDWAARGKALEEQLEGQLRLTQAVMVERDAARQEAAEWKTYGEGREVLVEAWSDALGLERTDGYDAAEAIRTERDALRERVTTLERERDAVTKERRQEADTMLAVLDRAETAERRVAELTQRMDVINTWLFEQGAPFGITDVHRLNMLVAKVKREAPATHPAPAGLLEAVGDVLRDVEADSPTMTQGDVDDAMDRFGERLAAYDVAKGGETLDDCEACKWLRAFADERGDRLAAALDTPRVVAAIRAQVDAPDVSPDWRGGANAVAVALGLTLDTPPSNKAPKEEAQAVTERKAAEHEVASMLERMEDTTALWWIARAPQRQHGRIDWGEVIDGLVAFIRDGKRPDDTPPSGPSGGEPIPCNLCGSTGPGPCGHGKTVAAWGSGDASTPEAQAVDVECAKAVERDPVGELGKLLDEAGLKARIAPTPTPSGPALAQPEPCPCPEAPARHKFSCQFSQPKPVAPEVVMNRDGVRVEKWPGVEDYTIHISTGGSAKALDVLARALAEAKRWESAIREVFIERMAHWPACPSMNDYSDAGWGRCNCHMREMRSALETK